MALVLIAPPPANPAAQPPVLPAPVLSELLLPDVKAMLRIDADTEDALLADLIGAAQEHVEGRDGVGNRSLLTQTWEWHVERFPPPGRLFLVPLPPLQSVTSIIYDDAAGVAQTWPAAQYQVTGVGDTLAPARILPVPGASWPLATSERALPVRIRFVAGYGTTLASIPRSLRLVLLGLVGHYYTARDADLAPPRWIEAMLERYRVRAA